MESVGEFFRQVRETKGLTIDEVASKTRIRTDFVKALEDGNFAKLPDQVFARGLCGRMRDPRIDEEDAIHRFIQSAGSFTRNRMSGNDSRFARLRKTASVRPIGRQWRSPSVLPS